MVKLSDINQNKNAHPRLAMVRTYFPTTYSGRYVIKQAPVTVVNFLHQIVLSPQLVI